ncbi:MAG: KR domain-containing protein, partial [Chloroflexota bacterium]
LQRLLGCLPVEQLRFLILFSSAAGFFGNVGQSDYALSNEILNRVAQRVKHANPACKVVSFNWGPWDMGMVTPQLRRLFAARGIEPIAVEAGTRAFVSLLNRDDAPALVLVGDGLGQAPAAPRETSLRCSRAITLEANPFLGDHRVGEHAVLPATCAMSWLAGAAEQLCHGYRLARIEGFQVLKGLVFDQALAQRHTLELVEAEATDGGVTLAALVRSQPFLGGPAAYHYRARLALSDRKPPAEPASDDWSLAEDGRAVDGDVLYSAGTLFHGQIFHGIERLLNANERRLTIRCRLPAIDDHTQGQFPIGTLNPFTADLHYQALVVWCRVFHDIAGLPLSVEQVLHHRHLPFDTTFYVTVRIRSINDYQVVANTTAHDGRGLAYSEFRGASLTLSRTLNEKFAAALALS